MKTTKVILGCALATGLMTLAAGKAQAVVIDGELYSPLNIKVTATYEKGTVLKKFSINSKDVLKDLGYNSNVILAVSDFGDPDEASAWVVNTKTSSTIDLTESGNLFVTSTPYVTADQSESKYTQSGLTKVEFFEDAEEGTNSANWFGITGIYSFKGSFPNNGLSEKFSATALSGEGFFESLDQDGNVPVSGTTTYSGSGKNVDD
jgi:hypothetical protein